jgi:hypothetical protein
MPHIRTDNQPLTQITVIEPEPRKQAEALSLMTERARFMARQPGFISISLHCSLDGRRIVNCIQRRSRDLLQSSHRSPGLAQGVRSVRSVSGRDRSPSVRGDPRQDSGE